MNLVDAIRQARSLGINFFDTTQAYGFGRSERLQGPGAGRRPAHQPGAAGPRPAELARGSVSARLRRLLPAAAVKEGAHKPTWALATTSPVSCGSSGLCDGR